MSRLGSSWTDSRPRLISVAHISVSDALLLLTVHKHFCPVDGDTSLWHLLAPCTSIFIISSTWVWCWMCIQILWPQNPVAAAWTALTVQTAEAHMSSLGADKKQGEKSRYVTRRRACIWLRGRRGSSGGGICPHAPITCANFTLV